MNGCQVFPNGTANARSNEYTERCEYEIYVNNVLLTVALQSLDIGLRSLGGNDK